MKQTKCVYCNSKKYKILFSQKDYRFFPDKTFYVAKCLSCGIYFTLPNLDIKQLTKFYPESYGAYDIKRDIGKHFQEFAHGKNKLFNRFIFSLEKRYSHMLYKEIFGKRTKRYFYSTFCGFLRSLFNLLLRRNCLHLLPYKKRNAKLLHIGSGKPKHFAKTMAKGIEIHTIDINKEICDLWKKQGIFSNYGTISDTDFKKESFDIIFFSHVIEHLVKPKEELRKLAKWLKKDGVMVCSFPIYHTYEWNHDKNFVYFDVPRHQIHLTKGTADMVFSDAGLKIAKKIYLPYGWGFFFTKYLKKCKTLENFDFDQGNKGRLNIKDYYLSFLLTFFNKSGHVIYYLIKR